MKRSLMARIRLACQLTSWVPTGLREPRRELFARTMNERPGRGLGHSKDVRDVLEGQSFLVAEHDGGSMLRAEGAESLLERAPEGGRLGGIGNGLGRRGIRQRLDLSRVVGNDDRSARPANRIDCRVVRDAKEPARKSARAVEGRQVEVSLDESVLCQVFRGRAIAPLAKDFADQADDRPLIPAHNPFECGLRSSKGFSDEPVLGDRLEVDRDGPRSSLYSLRRDRGVRCSASEQAEIMPAGLSIVRDSADTHVRPRRGPFP